MNSKNRHFWAYVLVFCLLITTALSNTGLLTKAEGTGTISMNVTSVTVNNTALTEAVTIKNGDELKIQFDWSLADGDTTLKLYADLSPYNVEFTDTTKRELQDKTDNYITIGQYWVENNKLWIELDENSGYQSKSDREGGATIYAKVNVSDANVSDGDKVEISVAGTTFNGTFDDGQTGDGGDGGSSGNTGIGVEKKVSGNVTPITVGDTTVYRQTYQIKLWAYGGDITNVSISDTYGDSLENMSSFTVVESSNDIFTVGSTYASIADINTAFSGQTFLQDKPVVFEYTMDVKADKVQGALDGSVDDTYKNTLTGTCTNTSGDTHTMNSSAWVTASTPSISKTGVLSDDNKTATWTITINLNGTSWADITSITDTPGTGFVGAGVGVALDKSAFTETSTGVYTYTYITTVDESYNGGVNGNSISNDVSMVTSVGNTFSTTGYVSLPGISNWVSKTATSYDDTTKTITWTVTVNVPAGVTDVWVTDRIRTDINSNPGNHKVEDTIVLVDGVKVAEGVTTDSSGNMSGTLVANDTNSDGVNDIVTEIGWKGVHISNDYLNAGDRQIEVTFTSEITDASMGGKTYTNMGIVRYTDSTGSVVEDYSDNDSHVAFATWENPNATVNALSKEGSAVSGENAIDYTVYIDLQNIGLPTEAELATMITNGQNIITITDTLPEGLTVDAGSVKVTDVFMKDGGSYQQFYEWEDYIFTQAGLTSADTTKIKDGSVIISDGTLSLGIIVDANLLTKSEFVLASTDLKGSGADYYPYLAVTYRAEVENVGELLKNGTTNYTNSVTGSFNSNPIGEADVTTSLTPQQVMSKSFVYSGSSSSGAATAPFVYYTVEVNPDAADLSLAGDTLTAVDKMGSALTYDLTSITVQAYKNGAWETLTVGPDYRFTYNMTENSLTFEVPDETYLKITYRARVVLEYSSTNNQFLGWNNAENKFSLYGYNSDASKTSTTINSNVLEPDAWAGSSSSISTSTSVTLYKYYTNDGVMTALPGAVFEVVQVTRNGSNWDEVAGTSYTVTVGDDGKVSLPNLVWDEVYKLTETQAPSGFVTGEPIYLMVPSYGNTSFPDGVILFGSGDTIYYENEKSPYTGSLTVEKSIEGLTWDDIKDSISFVVKLNGTEAYTLAGTDSGWVVSGDGKTATMELEGLTPGSYTVEEVIASTTVTTSGGTTYNLTKVLVEGADATNAANKVTGNFAIADGVDETATFANTYTEVIEEAELTIAKSVSGIDGTGAAQWAVVKDSLTFTVKDSTDATVATVLGSELTDADSDGIYSKTLTLEPGTYTVTETYTDVNGYTLKTVEYTIGTGAQTTGVSASVTFVAGDAKTVAFENTYEKNVGTIQLNKTITGLPDAELANAVNSMAFEITDTATGTVYTTVYVKDFTLSNGTYTEEVTLPVGNYTVKEVSYGVTDYLVETQYAIDGSTAQTGDTTSSIALAKDGTVEVDFANDYTKNEANLTITKSIRNILGDTNAEQWDVVKDSLTFTITDGMNTYTVKGTDLTDPEDDGTYSTTIAVKPGTYTVTETNTAVPNYVLKTILYMDEVGGSTKEQTLTSHASVTLVPEESDIVQFTNLYEHETETLTINKTVTGLPADVLADALANDKITYSVVCADIGYDQTLTLSDFTANPDGTYSISVSVLTGYSYTITETSRNVEGYDVVTKYTTHTNTTPAEGTTQMIPVVKGTGAEISFTNAYTQQTAELTVEKSVSGIEGATNADKWDTVKDTLTFTVTDAGGATVDTITGSELTDADSDGVYSTTITVPVGTYTVTETHTDVTGYTFEKVQYQVNAGSLTDGDAATLTLASQDEKAVTFTNTYSRDEGTLQLDKTITGLTGAELTQAQNSISFTIKDAATDQVYDTVYLKDFTYDAGTGTYTLANYDLPTGTYFVIEADYAVDGYLSGAQNTVDGSTRNSFETPDFEVKKGETIQIEFANTYTSTAGSFTIEKTVDGANWDAIKADISFIVKYKGTGDSDYSDYATILGTDAAWSVTGNVATYVLTGTTPGEYTVEEVLASDTATIDTKTYRLTKVTYVVTEDGAAGTQTDCTTATNKIADAVTMTNNGSAKVAFTNTYTMDRGTLTLNKTITGSLTNTEPADVVDAVVFVVEDEDTGTTYELKLKDFTYDSVTDTYTLADYSLPTGNYTVTESNYDVTGYLVDTKYSIAGGATDQTGDVTSAFAVTKDADTEVSFVNDYTKNEAELTITKTISGIEGASDEAKWNAVKDKLTFTITDTADATNTTTVSASTFTLSGGVYGTTLTLKPGTYTVTETYADVEGYTLSTTQYQIGAGGATTGTAANVTLAAEGTETVAFTNTYTRDKGNLQLDKLVTGLPDDVLADAITNQKISFVIKNVDTGIEYPYSLANFTKSGTVYALTKTDLPTGTYIVTETLTDISGYTATVQYSVNDGTSRSGYASVTPEFEIKKGETTQVAFSNTYTSTAGSLTIHKQVTGDITTGWEGVKDYISFTVTDANGAITSISPATHPFTDSDADGIYSYVVTRLTAGEQYTVTEVYSTISGYTHTVSYKVTAGSSETTGTGNETTVTVSATEGVEVTFTNHYTKVVVQPSNPTPPGPTPSITVTIQPTPSPSPEPTATPLPDGYILRPDGYIERPDGCLIAPDGTVLAAGRDRNPNTGDDSGIWTALFWGALSLLVVMQWIVYHKKYKDKNDSEKQ